MGESLVLPPRRSRKALVFTAGLGVTIAVLGTLAGPWEEMAARAPYAILGGSAFAGGGVLASLLVKRRG